MENQSLPPLPNTQDKMFPKRFLLIGGIIGLMALIGVGSLFAFNRYIQMPEKIIKKMMQSMSRVTSVKYSGKFTIPMGNMALSIPKDDKDLSLTENASNTLTINLSGAFKLEGQKPNFQIAVTSNVLDQNVGIEERTINNQGYLKLDIPFLSLIKLDFLQNKWIAIDPQKIFEKFGLQNTLQTQSLTPSPEQITKIKQAFQETNFITVAQKLPGENINGHNTYHYKFIINKDGITELIKTINAISDKNPITESQIDQSNQALDTTSKAFTGEIWIGKDDFLIYRINGVTTINQTIITNSIEFNNYNQAQQIETPEMAESIGQIFLSLATGSLSKDFAELTKNIKISDKKIVTTGTKDSDKDGLPDWLEKIYGTNPHNSDSDHDEFTDIKEIKNGYNPMGDGKLDW